MSQPPQIQQPQVVVVKSGCGKVAIILGCIAALIALLIGGCFVAGVVGFGKAASEAKKRAEAEERKEVANDAPAEISPIQWAEIQGIYGLKSDSTDIFKDEKWKSYKGKTVQWKGEVAEVTKDLLGNYTLAVKMVPETLTYDVSVKLRPDQTDAAFKLKKGDPVTFQARLVRWGSLLPITAENGVVVP